ncbi:MAG: hypothetical protein ABI222_11800 [Opitutaceae bacterium]
MNHRELPQVPQGMRRAGLCLALLLSAAVPSSLLGGLLSPSAFLPNPQLAAMRTNGYLPAHGAPPLRFAEPATMPELTVHPTAAASKLPALNSGDPSMASTPGASATSSSLTPSAAATRPTEATSEMMPSGKSVPLSILPDDLRPQVRPEDFLPFFQIPATQPGDVTLTPHGALAPAPQPASSATYHQQ